MPEPPRRPRPATSPTREKSHSPYRDSPSRRPHDLETGHNTNNPPLRFAADTYPPSPNSRAADWEPIMSNPLNQTELGRKKSLIRPERNRIDRDHPNYHYRKHAQNMEVFPSTTGNDPVLEDLTEARTV